MFNTCEFGFFRDHSEEAGRFLLLGPLRVGTLFILASNIIVPLVT